MGDLNKLSCITSHYLLENSHFFFKDPISVLVKTTIYMIVLDFVVLCFFPDSFSLHL